MKLLKLRRFLASALLALLLLAPLPVQAAASSFELYTGEVTAAGQGSAMDIRTNTMGWVTVNVTAASGTIAWDVWLEGSNDDGVTWEEIVAGSAMLTSGTATENAPEVNVRPIVNNKTTTAAAKFAAHYPFLPMKKIRLAWTLSGSTPSVTFTARFGGK